MNIKGYNPYSVKVQSYEKKFISSSTRLLEPFIQIKQINLYKTYMLSFF